MAVRTTTAPDQSRVIDSAPAGATRTCVGCRQKAVAQDLLRVVVAPAASGTAAQCADVPVVPDPRRRATGRGAWVHCDSVCVEQAQRRRAFARAFRLEPGRGVDLSAVARFVAEQRAQFVNTDRPSS